MTMNKKSMNVAGLVVNVYTDPTLVHQTSPLPIAVLFYLHGRLETSLTREDEIINVMSLIQGYAKDGQRASREMIVVSFDQRNHGSRLIDERTNLTWNTSKPENHNERHAYDMYAIQNGTARDVSFLIDFLPAYLFPDDSRVIKDWMVAGVSLGGHATWVVLKNEPRVKIGIPIIGCPDTIRLMESRAKVQGLKLEPPIFPGSFRAYVSGKTDPGSSGSEGYVGKRILVMSGADDQLVPWSASEPFVSALDVGKEGVKKVIVEEGVGHKCTKNMQAELANFVWEQCVGASGSGNSQSRL